MTIDTDYEQRLQAALAELQTRGVRKRIAQPPYFRLARKLNIQLKPPYYASFGFNATFSCAVFALIWGVTMWFIAWSRTDMSLTAIAMNSLNAGLIVGLVTALFCYAASRFHKLTRWDSLLEQDSRDQIRTC